MASFFPPLDIDDLRRQHRGIMLRATHLRGLGDQVRTREDALEARAAIEGVDQRLVEHLLFEDNHLYPALMACDDPRIAAMAADCAEEMGGIIGAWIAYRSQWTAPAILADPQGFKAVTAGVIGALAMRIERENAELYPAGEALAHLAVREVLAAE